MAKPEGFEGISVTTTQGVPGTGDASIYFKGQKRELQKSQARGFFFF